MITINKSDILGNEVKASLQYSVEIESHPWKLREQRLNLKTSSGHKYTDIETITGLRILVGTITGTYADIPKNNDSVITDVHTIYGITALTITATGVDTSTVNTLSDYNKSSADYHTQYKIFMNKLSSGNFSIQEIDKLQLKFDELTPSYIAVSTPVLDLKKALFAENNGLNISYWSNGPYVDLKATFIQRDKIILP